MKNRPQKKTIIGPFYNSTEVQVLLRIDATELKKMRINDELSYFRIAGEIYYDKRDVEEALQNVMSWINQ